MDAHVEHPLRARVRRAHEDLPPVIARQPERRLENGTFVAPRRARPPADDGGGADVRCSLCGGPRCGPQRADRRRLAAGGTTHHGGGEGVQRYGARRDADELCPLVDHGLAQTQIEDRQGLLGVGPYPDDRSGVEEGVQGGRRAGDPRVAERQLVRGSRILDARVDVRGSDGLARQSSDGKSVLRGQVSTRQYPYALCAPEPVSYRAKGRVPAHRLEALVPGSLKWGVEALVGIHVVVAEAPLVAGPEVVHVLVGKRLTAHELLGPSLVREWAADGAVRAHAGCRLEVPRPGNETVRPSEQRADGADLDRVPGEVAVERLVREGEDLGAGPSLDKLYELIARHLVGEANTPPAQHAALAVEYDL